MIGLAGVASSERNAIRLIARSRAGFAIPQARGLVALIYFAICLGTAIALGFLPANVFVLVGSLAACVVVRSLLSENRTWTAAWWLVPIGWSLLAGALRFRTVDLESVLGAQAALGPGALVLPTPAAAIAGAASVVGLVSGVFWVASLPRLDTDRRVEVLDSVLRWGECALVAAVALSPVGGLLVGTLAHGPLTTASALRAAAAFGAVALGTVLVSVLRRTVAQTPGGPARWVFGALSLAALAATVVLR